MPIQRKETKKFITDSPKVNFFFGLILGVALISTIGYFTNVDSSNVVKNKDNNKQVAGEQQPPQKVELKIEKGDHLVGNKNAKVKIFTFSDFQCPYCARFHEVMNKIVTDYGDKVVWISKQFPISSHPLGMAGAIASECAAEQGKFSEMSDKIFANQKTLTKESFTTFAKELELDVDQFNACVSEERPKDKILKDYNLGVEGGVGGTPTSFINGEAYPGAVPYENMKQIIDDLL